MLYAFAIHRRRAGEEQPLKGILAFQLTEVESEAS